MREQRKESDKFEVAVGMHHLLFFSVMVDVTKWCLSALLYAHNVVLMREKIQGLRKKVRK